VAEFATACPNEGHRKKRVAGRSGRPSALFAFAAPRAASSARRKVAVMSAGGNLAVTHDQLFSRGAKSLRCEKKP
jgi:hypothetical protein